MTPAQLIEVIKAFEEGKEIEIWDGRSWITCNPGWYFASFKYRVKQTEDNLSIPPIK